MSPFYRRTTPGFRENLGAAAVAAGLALGVASVSFYLVRTFLAREPMEPLPRPPADEGRGVGRAEAVSPPVPEG
jgi:DNA-binding transcriptional LysR family regulator